MNLRERLGARDGFNWFIIEDLCASLGPSLGGLDNNFCAGLNKLLDEAFRECSIGSQIHADTTIDRITPPF